MRTRPTFLTKTCPYCGGRSRAEAKLPASANLARFDYDLDNLGALVEKQSLGLLLALVELLPYKTFVCQKCQGEFRMESRSTKELVGSMLASMQPVIPKARPGHAPAAPLPAAKGDWEAESLDAVLAPPAAPGAE